ncbi:MAG: hypothetical protein JSV86_06820, partial [Gemmatimonadota bacterium]
MASYALNPVPGSRAAAASYALREAAREEPGVIQGALTTLGRLGYITRNVIAGDFEGALGQAAVLGSQLVSAPFTGGVSLVYPDVSILGAASALGAPTSAAELAPFETQREFSDLLAPETLELLDAEDGWRRVAIDVLGGVITDPLSLLSGGVGGVGSAGKGLISGTLRGAAPNIMRALRATSKGRSVADDALEIAKRALPRSTTPAEVERVAARSVMEDAYRRSIGGTGPVPSMFRMSELEPAVPTAFVEQATKQLMSEGVMAPFTVRVAIPFTAGKTYGLPSIGGSSKLSGLANEFVYDLVNPFNRNFIASMLGGAVAGPAGTLAARAAMKFTPLDDIVTNAVAAVSRNLVNKFGDPRLPPVLQQELRAMFGDVKAETAEIERKARYIFGGPEWGNSVGWTPEQMEALTEHFEWLNDRIYRRRNVAKSSQRWIDKEARKLVMPGPQPA